MYSLWRCVRAKSNASSSAARYVLTVWFQLQPSTGFTRCGITTNIKHVLPAPLLETSTFSGVSLNSLKTLLVLSDRRILRPSPQLAWRIGGSPNLIIASCNGLRQSSRPHHCLPQWFASNQSVGGRLGNHNAAPHRLVSVHGR